MAIRGTVITRLEMPSVRGVSESAKRAAARQTAAEVEALIQRRCSRPNVTGTRPSRPGEYPKRVSSDFKFGANVTGTPNYLTIATVEPYGEALQFGTLNMAPRPWADKALAERDWAARYKKLAREFGQR